MTKFILIIVWQATSYGKYNNHAWHEVAMQEFNSERACMVAAQVVIDRAQDLKSATCVPKGKE